MEKKARAAAGPVSSLRMKRKMERLSLIKERYRELILEPRRRIEMELDRGFDEEYLEEVESHEAEPEEVFADITEDDDVF